MGYQFLIKLRESKPLVSRRLIIPADYTFYQFHLAIQGAFGWENCHLFQFSKKDLLDKEAIGIPHPENEIKVRDANTDLIRTIFKKPGVKFSYTYDFGDYWCHDIVLEEIIPQECYRPFCIAAKSACPPEDVGGFGGYSLMLEALADPKHPEYKSYREWAGLEKKEIWDATFASTREINKRLALLE